MFLEQTVCLLPLQQRIPQGYVKSYFVEKSASKQEVSIIIGQGGTKLLPVSQENYRLRWSKDESGWEIMGGGNLGDNFAKRVCVGGEWRKRKV